MKITIYSEHGECQYNGPKKGKEKKALRDMELLKKMMEE